MIQFANPIWLWSLTGLLIPIAIHLLSRKEGKVIRFGSLRHLRESNTARFRSLKLNEIILLFLRCLLLAFLVLFMAGMQCSTDKDDKQKWLVVEKGIENSPQFKILADSLEKQGYEAHYFTDGFPPLKDTVIDIQQNYWLLVEDLRTKPLQEVVVASYNYAKNYKGERISLPDNFRWIAFEPPSSSSFPANAIRINNDSVITRLGNSTANVTSFEFQKNSLTAQSRYFKLSNDSVIIPKCDSIIVNVVSDKGFEFDQKIIIASLRAIQSVTPHKLIINTFSTSAWKPNHKYNWLIILTHDTEITNSTTANSKNIIALSECQSKNLPLLIQSTFTTFSCEQTKNTEWIITRRLNEENALKENLTLTLAKILLPEASTTTTLKNDKRVLPEAMAWSASPTSKYNSKGVSTGGERLIVFLILATLLTERLLSYKRNQ